MKKHSLSGIIPALFVCLLFVSGCNKLSIHLITNEAASLCTIKRISFNPEGVRDTLTLSYNALGNPIKGANTFPYIGVSSYLFRYDKQDRLQDFIMAGENGSAISWTRYYYSDDNATVIDTIYTDLPDIINWPQRSSCALNDFITDLKTYDQEGRITLDREFDNGCFDGKTVSSLPAGGMSYVYDSKGNANTVGYDITYDNKINYHRTNKVWMFIDNQYSVNNPLPIDEYNIYDLPVEINFNITPPAQQNSEVLLGLYLPQAIIGYDCDVPKIPGQASGLKTNGK